MEFAKRRLRNQISNMLLFGSLVAFASLGLVLGAMAGVALAGRTGLADAAGIWKIATVISTTLGGLCAGVAASFYVSPVVLRYAFFAERVGEWHGANVYACDAADLPGGMPNVFVAGFRRGIGPFRPAIFASRESFRILGRDALEAVFAHEMSHLSRSHLRKRLLAGMATFLVASVLTSAMLLGAEWSGYTSIGGGLATLAGILPAALTWLTMRNMTWTQELEADEGAIRIYGASPGALLSALERLQAEIGGETHPLVSARMRMLKSFIESAPMIAPTQTSVSTATDRRAA
jgi:Zn-dependent protease with chaperone function